jgi:hypothetical protein
MTTKNFFQVHIKFKIISFIVLSLYSNNLFCQSNTDRIFFSVQGEYSNLLPHHKELDVLSLNNFPNFELNIYKQTTGEAEWEKQWNYPQTGVSLYYSALSNKSVFGQAYAIMPFGSFTFFRRPKHEQRFMVACGLGYLTKPFDSISNPDNPAIGTHLNAAVKFQYSFLYRLSPNYGLSLGASFAHFSNGVVKFPDWGLNLLSLSGALHFKLNNKGITYVEPVIAPFQKQWIPYASAVGAIKQDSKWDPNFYSVFSFGSGVARNYKYGKEWMIGADVMWDNSDKSEFSSRNEYPTTLELFKLGVYGGHEWNFSKVAIVFQTGVYLYKYAYFSIRDDDPIYSRLAIRYKITDELQANVSIKSHFIRADYLEWGLVYRFIKKQDKS